MAGSRFGRLVERGATARLDDGQTVNSYPRSKRALDLTVGSVALAVALPVMVAIRAVMLVTNDAGPFLYRASRVGEGGASITVLKIRTMTPRAEGTMITMRHDPRVTRLGRGLRRTKLDELPQLWNVLRGDMALVGPRPEDATYVDWSDPLHRRVFEERPGITGLAQLEFRNEAVLLDGPYPERTYREAILPAKLALDCEYLDHRSIRLDLVILARTVGEVIRIFK